MSQVNSGIDWRGRLWAYAPLILWVCVIFLLSSPQGSMSETSRIIGPLITFFFPEMPEASRQIIHGYVRKTAHFTEYAMLAFLTARACAATLSLARWRYLVPVASVSAVAFLDEFNQTFLASRTGSIWDVALDISGGIVMITALWLIGRPRPWAEEPDE